LKEMDGKMKKKTFITTANLPAGLKDARPVKKVRGPLVTSANMDQVKKMVSEGISIPDSFGRTANPLNVPALNLPYEEKQPPVSPPEAQTEADEGEGQGICQAKKKDGSPCTLPARNGEFCHIHQPKDQ